VPINVIAVGTVTEGETDTVTSKEEEHVPEVAVTE
jgi:hypothetical protein